jgi:benzoate-CoA ligase family protein
VNVGRELVERSLTHPGRVAFIDSTGRHTYEELARRSRQFARSLHARGIGPGERLLLVLDDTFAFPVCFLGALQAGVVAVPLSTLLTADNYAFIAADSEATGMVASPNHVERLPAGLTSYCVEAKTNGWLALYDALDRHSGEHVEAIGSDDDTAFWLYTSGTTGKPKGVMHSHADVLATADTYGKSILNLKEDDVVFSAAKFFFAYGLGNSLTFPLSVGATVVLLDGPPQPQEVLALLDEHRPTVFFGVPTLYAMLLNAGCVPRDHRLRLCISAGEALPEAIFRRWKEATGVEILDGIGSTEMLHIFMSNRSGDVQPGTSGFPVPGYRVRLLDEDGGEVADGDMGDLYVAGPSRTSGYWKRPEIDRSTFHGEWMRSGDKYRRTESGAFAYCGRSDDLLKVGGVYVSPMEVENALLEHPTVAEAAVVGQADADDLIKPKAFVVVSAGSDVAAQTLIDHVAGRLVPYKRPRWIEFVDELPKTATGKIQRFKLRG